ncbi:MAG: hypothetical protein V4505_25565 [Pseudomonadota bacterium]
MRHAIIHPNMPGEMPDCRIHPLSISSIARESTTSRLRAAFSFRKDPMNRPTTLQQPTDRLSRMVDLRIPLWGLLCGCTVVGWGLISMWFMVNQLVKDVGELQITVKAGGSQATTIAGEMAILRFRVENLEGDKRAAAAVQAK